MQSPPDSYPPEIQVEHISDFFSLWSTFIAGAHLPLRLCPSAPGTEGAAIWVNGYVSAHLHPGSLRRSDQDFFPLIQDLLSFRKG